jgi:predicted outer membrane repeat protein
MDCLRSSRRMPCLMLMGILVAAVLAASPASAARYHVLTSGTRIEGESVPDDWSDENCYAVIDSAAAAAAAGDTILLAREDHVANASVVLPAFLGNRDLDGMADDCRVLLAGEAQFTFAAEADTITVRGISCVGDGLDSDAAAFAIAGMEVGPDTYSFEDCVFTGNSGSDLDGAGGSCLQVTGAGEQRTVAVERCRFEQNSCRGYGGALYVGDGWDLSLTECEFVGNACLPSAGRPIAHGGAVAVMSPLAPSAVLIEATQFTGNESAGPGGACFVEDASLTLLGSDFVDNRTAVGAGTNWASGAGVLMRRAAGHAEVVTFTAEQCTFSGNFGDLTVDPWAGDGGGLNVRGAFDLPIVEVAVAECVFQDNYNAQGGGISLGQFVVGTVQRCRFSGNRALLQGGAFYKGGGNPESAGETVTVEYCEFDGNDAGLDRDDVESTLLGRGGAAFVRLAPSVEFINCTFHENTVHGPLQRGDAIMSAEEEGTYDPDDPRACVVINCAFYATTGNDYQVYGNPRAFRQVSHNAWQPDEFFCADVVPEATVDLIEFPFIAPDNLDLPDESPLVDAGLDVGLTEDILGRTVPDGDAPDIGCYEARIITAVAQLPGAVRRVTAWPNPFNPRVTVAFTLAAAADIRLEVYDLRGRRLATLAAGEFAAGTYERSWDASGLSSGTYAYRLSAGGGVLTGKLQLVR